MTYAWGDETVSGQGVDSRCYPSSTKDERLKNRVDEFSRRQQQEHYRRSAKKERKQKNTSISSLPSMQSSSLRSILKPSTSTENLVMSNYLDKRCRIEDIDGNVPPGVQAYWMRDQQLRKSLKRGKKVQFNENSNNSKRKVRLPRKNSKSHESEDYHIYDEVDSDGRMSARAMKSDEETYCKKRVCTPVASRRVKQNTANENVKKNTKHNENVSNRLPHKTGKFDHYDGSSSSNYSYSSKEIATSQECPQNLPNPPEAERCMFVRSCVKVAGDPNEDIIAFNELRRQSINRMNAFVRSSGRYSQRGYQAYSSTVNRRINAPTRRSMHGNPYFTADGRDIADAHGNHVYVPASSVYANDFARSSLRMSSRGVPKNWPVSGGKAPPETVPEGRAPGTFERSYVRGSRRSRQSVGTHKQDGAATTRGSTRRQSQRRRTVIADAIVDPSEARESVRRSKYRRDDRGLNSCSRQSMKVPTRNQPEVQPEESQFKVPVTHLSSSQQDTYPSSSSSSPYYVRNTVPHVANAIQEETNVLPEAPPLSPEAPPFCRAQQITNNNVIHQEANVESIYETAPIQLEEDQLNVPGGGGVPTVGGKSNRERNIMLPLAEAVVAGALRRSARQKKRGIAYFTIRKSRGEAVSDLEVISEDQPGRLSPATTDYNEGHWSAPESRTVVKHPVVPPKPPPRLDKLMAQQNTIKPVPTFAGNAYYKETVPVKAIPSNPLVFNGRPKRQLDVVDDNPISLTDAAQQLEKQFALIGRRSPPIMQPSSSSPSPLPDSARTTTPLSQLTEEASPDVSKGSKEKEKESKTKKQGKKSKKNRKKKKNEEKEEREAEKKAKKKEEKEKKEKKKDKKKKKKKEKAKTKGDIDAVDKKKQTGESAQESENTNPKPLAKKAPLKPPRKRSSDVANTDNQQSGFDAESITGEQGHLTVINVVSRDNENDDASDECKYKRKSGLTRLTRKISDRVGTWGKDFKRLLSFRRQKPREDVSSGIENEDSDFNDVHENTEETTQDYAMRPVVGHAQMNASGAYLPSKSQPKVPLLPPKCTPVPPPNVPTNKTDEDGLNFCDEGKTNQIIYWLQNAYNNQNIEEQLAMLTATTVATQF